jgi:hypothetical protein
MILLVIIITNPSHFFEVPVIRMRRYHQHVVEQYPVTGAQMTREVHVSIQNKEISCICVLGVSILHLFDNVIIMMTVICAPVTGYCSTTCWWYLLKYFLKDKVETILKKPTT